MVGGLFGTGLGQDLNWCLTKSTIFKPRRNSRQTVSFDILCSGDLLNLEPSEDFQLPPSYLEVGYDVFTFSLVVPIDLVDDQSRVAVDFDLLYSHFFGQAKSDYQRLVLSFVV